jgi:uncharacterized protein
VGRGALIALGGLAVAAALFFVDHSLRAAAPAAPENYFDPSTGGYLGGGVCSNDPEQCDFMRAVLGSLEDEWKPLIEGDRVRSGGGGDVIFDTPTLVVFSQFVATPCGDLATERGPIYCPEDRNFYIDPAWLDGLARHAPGDMGQAIIIAHEYAHWVQSKMGVGESIRRFTRQNSVRYELQADCLAGVWASLAKSKLAIDETDLSEAIAVAEVIGNDAMQSRAGGAVQPSTFTHGSSQQRARWMQIGFESDGDTSVCATFDVPYERL